MLLITETEPMMSDTQLLEKLRNLHEELLQVNVNHDDDKDVDESTLSALEQLVTDANRLIQQAHEADEDLTDEHKDLLDRVVQFNNEHPRVSQFLSQMTDLLAMMGI